MNSQPSVICDVGTGYMKMGFSNQNFPRRTFPSIVGRPMLRFQETIDDVQLKPIMVGDEVAKYRSLLQLTYPTTQGIVQNWDDMSLLLDYSFKQIGRSDMRNKSLFMTEAVMNPVKNKVKMAQVLFQKFGIGRLQIGVQALLSLFAEGLQTALLLDSGDGVTHCIPVFQGYILSNQIGRMNIAGRHITNHLVKLMHMRGYAFNSTADFETIRQMKQRYCFVSGDFKVDQKLSLQTTHHEKVHTLPDGTKIKIGRERFLAPQIIFKPSLAGIQADGCGEMIFNSINKCEITLRKNFYQNILISGGTTMFPGFPTRLKNDVESLYRQRILKGSTTAKGVRIHIIDPPTRRYNVFLGATFIAKSTAEYPQSWISKQAYQQHGARIIEKINTHIS